MAVEAFERKLAAVLAADVVGYSRLMGDDEAGTPRPPQGAAPGVHRAQGRRAPRPHRQAHRRRRAGRVRERGRRGARARSRSSRAWPSGRRRARRRAGGSCFRIGINLGDVIVEERRHLRRRRQRRGPARGAGASPAASASPARRPPDDPRASSTSPSRTSASDEVKNIAEPVRVWRWINDAPATAATTRARRGQRPRAAGQALDRRAAVRQHERATRSRTISPTA